MFEGKKIQDIRNKKNIDEQLRSQGVCLDIVNNPRYQSILSRISSMIMSNRIREFSTNVDSEGNVILTQSEDNRVVMCMKYYIDKKEECLKRIKIDYDLRGCESKKRISTYNEYGIEESMMLIQNFGNERYLSRTSRLEGRPDLIKIERISEDGEPKRLSDVYQSRIFFVALEDIDPDEIDIDPLETSPFAFLGKAGLPPNYYVDVTPEEAEMLDEGVEPFLPEEERESQFKLYRETNKTYCRTSAFEEGIADMLGIEIRLIDFDDE